MTDYETLKLRFLSDVDGAISAGKYVSPTALKNNLELVIQSAITQHEAEQWKSYPENVPERHKSYLVLMNYGDMDVCRYVKNSWVNDLRPQHSNGDVIAFRELPKPYQP